MSKHKVCIIRRIHVNLSYKFEYVKILLKMYQVIIEKSLSLQMAIINSLVLTDKKGGCKNR